MKLGKGKKAKTAPKTEREKEEERREEVLAKGRKFKYPLQYTKHKLVINTILVAAVAVVAMVVAGWLALYQFQSTGEMMYRVTQVLPVPVAEVEGAKVRYSDYLMIYRSNLQTSEQQSGQLGNTEDDDLVRAEYKRTALEAAVEYTYAMKLGKELGLSVSEEEIDQAFDEHRKVGGVERSEEAFLKIVQDNFGMNQREYRRMLELTLMKAKVEQEIDETAQAVAAEVETMLNENGGDMAAVAESLGEQVEYEATGQLVDNMNVDGGRSNKAMTLEPGQVSERFLSNNGDGYYFVKLVEKTETQVNYESIKVKFTTFAGRVAQLYEEGKVKNLVEI